MIDHWTTGIAQARAQVRLRRAEYAKKIGVKCCVPNRPYADKEVKSCLPILTTPNPLPETKRSETPKNPDHPTVPSR